MAKRTDEFKSKETLATANAIREGEDVPLPARYTEDGIAERREHVWRFLVRRVPQTVMADLLGVSRRTIADDVLYWKEEAQKQVAAMKSDPTVANADIGLAAGRLEGIAVCAMNDYELAKAANTKNLFLAIALKAEVARANLLMNTGVLPKAGEEIRVSHSMKATFEARLGSADPLATLDEPVSRRRVLDAAERILKLSMERRKLNDKTIDAKAEPKAD